MRSSVGVVVPLDRGVLPGDNAGPVERVVEFLAVHVDAHPDSVDVSLAQQFDVLHDAIGRWMGNRPKAVSMLYLLLIYP